LYPGLIKAAGHWREPGHQRQTTRPRSPQEAHQRRFQRVILSVRDQNKVRADPFRLAPQRLVPEMPRRCLDSRSLFPRPSLNPPPSDRLNRTADPQIITQRTNRLRIPRAFFNRA
jgi:hypothetical protein